MCRYYIRQRYSNSSKVKYKSGKHQVPALSYGLGCLNNKGIYILVYLINNSVKINGWKQIVLLIIRTTIKKQYKSRSMINCEAINKFINTQFMYIYNLPILPFAKARAL